MQHGAPILHYNGRSRHWLPPQRGSSCFCRSAVPPQHFCFSHRPPPDATMLTLGTSLTNQNAAAVLRDGLARVAQGGVQGKVQVDCTSLAQVDSSAVAVLLAWHRAAAA